MFTLTHYLGNYEMLKTLFNILRYKREVKNRTLFSHRTLLGYKGVVKTHPFDATLDRLSEFHAVLKKLPDMAVSKDPRRRTTIASTVKQLYNVTPTSAVVDLIESMQFGNYPRAKELLVQLEKQCVNCRNLVRRYNYQNARYFATVDADEQVTNEYEHELDEIVNYYSLELHGVFGLVLHIKNKLRPLVL